MRPLRSDDGCDRRCRRHLRGRRWRVRVRAGGRIRPCACAAGCGFPQWTTAMGLRLCCSASSRLRDTITRASRDVSGRAVDGDLGWLSWPNLTSWGLCLCKWKLDREDKCQCQSKPYVNSTIRSSIWRSAALCFSYRRNSDRSHCQNQQKLPNRSFFFAIRLYQQLN